MKFKLFIICILFCNLTIAQDSPSKDKLPEDPQPNLLDDIPKLDPPAKILTPEEQEELEKKILRDEQIVFVKKTIENINKDAKNIAKVEYYKEKKIWSNKKNNYILISDLPPLQFKIFTIMQIDDFHKGLCDFANVISKDDVPYLTQLTVEEKNDFKSKIDKNVQVLEIKRLSLYKELLKNIDTYKTELKEEQLKELKENLIDQIEILEKKNNTP